MKKALFTLGIVALIWACGDKETTPANDDNNNNNNTAICDTLIPTYDEQIGNILNGSCFPCHTSSSEGGINVSNYTNAKAAAQQDAFLKAIKHEAGVSPMPQGGSKLGDQTIQYIECWIENGYPEN